MRMHRALYMVALCGICSVVFAATVHAAVSHQLENGVTVFVEFAKERFTVGEDITFTVRTEGDVSGESHTAARIDARTGTNAYTQVVAAGDTATTTLRTLPGITTLGTHVVDFRVLGALFDQSNFDEARFDTPTETFSTTIEVAEVIPYPPRISYVAFVGEPSDFTVQAEDPDNSAIYYEVYFDDEDVRRIPPSGSVPSNTPMTFTRTWFLPGTHTLFARAVDTDAHQSPWNSATFTLVATCSYCTYTGGTPEVSMRAEPPLVQQGQRAMLSWQLKDVGMCTITGTNGEVWEWDTVKSANMRQTLPITQSTRYTLTCETQSGTPVSASVTIDMAPLWEEF